MSIFKYASDNAKSYNQRKEMELLQQQQKLQFMKENKDTIYNAMVEKLMNERELNNAQRGLRPIQRAKDATGLNAFIATSPSQTQSQIANNQTNITQQRLNKARLESEEKFLSQEELVRQNQMKANVKASDTQSIAADVQNRQAALGEEEFAIKESIDKTMLELSKDKADDTIKEFGKIAQSEEFVTQVGSLFKKFSLLSPGISPGETSGKLIKKLVAGLKARSKSKEAMKQDVQNMLAGVNTTLDQSIGI